MLDAVQGTGDRRIAVVTPTPKGGFNGEGAALSRAGIPTTSATSPFPVNPLAGPQNGCIEKLDKRFLYDQFKCSESRANDWIDDCGTTEGPRAFYDCRIGTEMEMRAWPAPDTGPR